MRGPPRRQRHLLGAIALAAALAGARTARADGAGVIVAQSPARAQVAAALAAAMAGRATRVVPDAVAEARAAHAAGAVPVATLAQFKRVREQIDDGWRAYLRVAVEVAAVKLAAARAAAEPLVALAGGAELYADAALRLGVVLGHLGREPESRAVIALALRLDPERPVTLAEFAPDVVERIEAVRAAAPVREPVRVVTTPPGARVVVDRDTPVGAAARGQHLLIARAPGYVPLVVGVAPPEGDATPYALALEPDEDAQRLAAGATRGTSEPLAQRLIDATLRFGDFDEVVVAAATVRRGGPTLLVQRCAGAPARCSAVVDVGYGEAAGLPAAAREAWAAVRAGELRYAPAVLADRGDGVRGGGGESCAVCRSPWLWGGVGAAVVIGAVVTVLVVSGEQAPPRVAVDPSLFRAP